MAWSEESVHAAEAGRHNATPHGLHKGSVKQKKAEENHHWYEKIQQNCTLLSSHDKSSYYGEASALRETIFLAGNKTSVISTLRAFSEMSIYEKSDLNSSM